MDNNTIGHREMKFCHNCNSIIETERIYKHEIESYDNENFHGNGVFNILSKCLKCKAAILSEIRYQYFEDHYTEEAIQLYPNSDNLAIKNCPKIVINPYHEAIKCYRAQAYDACVIMCRKGIEAICLDKGEEKGNLRLKLKNLKEKKILEGTLFNWTNELRMIGNDGAHSHDQIITQQDAKDALDFFDALITYLYHLVNQYEQLVERRDKSKIN